MAEPRRCAHSALDWRACEKVGCVVFHVLTEARCRRPPCCQHYSGRAGVLSRPAKPPPYGCFTVPAFQLLPALESLFVLLFANLFWVGLWDLLDNTIFPNENSIQMLSLVRVRRRACARSQVLGLQRLRDA